MLQPLAFANLKAAGALRIFITAVWAAGWINGIAVRGAEVDNPAAPIAPPPKRDTAVGSPSHETRRVEGWTVFIHTNLLAQDRSATERALDLLQQQLAAVARLVPARPLAQLRAVPLWFSPEYPNHRPTAEYHPDVQWLRDEGRSPAMAKSIEFSNVRRFEAECRRMPMLVLHELAHAYHDRVLGFDHAGIKAAFAKARAGGRYDTVERTFADGRTARERAYALQNEREYFAEGTEAFFGRNDWFPYTRADLKTTDPDLVSLLAELWMVPP